MRADREETNHRREPPRTPAERRSPGKKGERAGEDSNPPISPEVREIFISRVRNFRVGIWGFSMLSEINGSRVDFGDDSSDYGGVLGFGRVWVWFWSWPCRMVLAVCLILIFGT